ncbi:MAG TPA: helix-turn-helix domain-containing protein [Spirochaetota bacterium]|nr:helix-turn-helix domain-containing protein [Spirochaetota bacterium]
MTLPETTTKTARVEIPYREQLVRYDGAAEITKLSTGTLRKYVSARKIPFVKIGKAKSKAAPVLFRVGDLLDWTAGQAVQVDTGK